MADQNGGRYGEQRNEGVEHGHGAGLLEVVAAVIPEEDGEAENEDADVQYLAKDDETELHVVLLAALVLAVEGLQDGVGPLVDDVATVDDFLTPLHHAAGQRDVAEHVVLTGLAALLVINEVGQDVVVEAALGQLLLELRQHGVGKQLLVCADGGVEFLDGFAAGALTVDDADGLRGVGMQAVVLRRVHDALAIELVQLVDDDGNALGRNAGDAVGIVFGELLNLAAFDGGVEVVVRLELPEQAVALPLHHLFALVDREIERCREVGITPGLADFYLVIVLVVAGHGPYNQRNGAYHNQDSGKQIAPVGTAYKLVIFHFFVFSSAKIQKICQLSIVNYQLFRIFAHKN